MTDKEQYRELCKKELSIPIYSLDWWLDCVCENNKWDVLLFKNNDRIEAAMIYYSPAKKIITMPAYTQTMGIWFNPEFENRNYSDNLYRKQKICCFFIEHLPVHTFFLQYFHSSFTDWLPFYWNGYKQTTRYNYILPDINDTDKLFKCLGGDAKRNIAKAQKKFKLRIERKIPLDLFMEQYNMTFKQKGLKVYHPEILVKIITTCIVVLHVIREIYGLLLMNKIVYIQLFSLPGRTIALIISLQEIIRNLKNQEQMLIHFGKQ